MNAGRPTQLDRYERLMRGLLGLALLVGVLWALADGAIVPALGLDALRR